MFKASLKGLFLGGGLVILIGLGGCDQIQSIFSGKSEKTSASAPAVDPSLPLPANVLAQVGNWTITVDEFNTRLANLKQALPAFDSTNPESKKLILTELVNQQLLINDAEQSGAANKKEITDAVQEFKRSLLVRDVAVKLTKDITVTDQEAQDFYDKNKDNLKMPIQYHLREIKVETEDAAKEISAELSKGTDFSELAKTRSKSASAANGGDIGFVAIPNSSQMESVVKVLEVGGVSSAFQGPDGFYIVKLEEKKGGEQADFATIKTDIVAYITQLKQQQAIAGYVEQLKQKAAVRINEGIL